MSNIYNVFNTTSEYEFSKFFDKLDLTTNELLNVSNIAESNSLTLDEKRERILEVMAGSADGNYELCTEQFKKVHKQRVLKESSQLSLNQIMELNELVVNVAKKLQAPNCMKGIFNIIKTKAGANVANTFLGMVQQSQVNNTNLKFNTELQVNGKNLAQLIYQIKNDIEMFVNSVECEKEEPKEEIKENKQIVQETYAKYKQIVQEIDRVVDEVSNIDLLKSISKRIENMLSRVKNMNEANEIAELKSAVETKINSLMDAKPQIEECLTQQLVADVCEEDTFDGLMKSLKPTVINITVNKEGGVEEVVPCEEPQQCVQPMNTAYPQPVEDMDISPNVIDAPILKKPNSAEATSALTALASHVNCVKSDSRENNIEELETINTLLAQLANYFNSVLNESEYKVGQKVIWKKNGMTYTISNVKNGFYDLKDGYSNKTYPVSKETLNSNFKILNESVNFDEMSEQEIKDYGMNVINTYDLNPNQEWKFKDMKRSFHPTSFYYNHKGMVVINIEYIGEDRHGINSGIITADGFEDNVKSGRLELLSTPEDYWDGEDEEDLMENKHYRIEVSDIEYDIPYYTEEEIELDEEDDTPDTLRRVIDDRITDKAGISPSDFGYEITDSWSDDEDDEDEGERSEYDNDYWDGEDEELTEDTVYDHSWYENESGKYPSRTKDGVIGLPIKETCSAGATCSANVSGFAKPLGSKPKKRKKSTIELDMFKESIQNDLNSALEINGQMVAYRIFEGKGYLYINEAILKETDKDAILEAIDDIYNDCLETPVLEGFTPYQLEILMEEDLIQPENELEPQENQELQDDLDNEINTNSNLKVGMLDNTGGISTEQEIVGVDDTDMNDKKYVLKDPQSGKVKIANASQIKVIGN